jgi:hypothetical protein
MAASLYWMTNVFFPAPEIRSPNLTGSMHQTKVWRPGLPRAASTRAFVSRCAAAYESSTRNEMVTRR